MSASIGIKVLLKLVRQSDTYELAKCKLQSEYFIEPELPVWEFIQSHLEDYSVIPQESTLIEKGVPDIETPEPFAFYVDQLIDRYTQKKLGVMTQEVIDNLNQAKLTEAKGVLTNTLSHLTSIEVRQRLISLVDDAETEYTHLFKQKNSGLLKPIGMGWPYLDNMTGGLVSGDIVSIVGRPGQGKSFIAMYSALQMWREQKKNILFVSMEMPAEEVLARMIAMYTKVDPGNVKKAELSNAEMSLVIKGLGGMAMEDTHFWVLDANLSGTVMDIFSIGANLKPDVVFVDGAYLLRSTNSRLGRYERVAENAELLKKMAHNAGIPCVPSWQFNREASKKNKKSEVMGLEDIAYSDVIGQISSIVLGLFEEDALQLQELKSRRVMILKGRSGEAGEFTINWKFNTGILDFSEVEQTDEVLEVL
jgi:replicative DNA helicase